MVINLQSAKDDLKTLSTTNAYDESSTLDSRSLALLYWGEYVANNTDLFDPYWVQFPPPPRIVEILLGIFIALVGILSVLGNGIVCFTFLRSPSLRNQKLFTVNLAMSDLIAPLLTYHMFVISCYEGVWVYSKDWCNYYALIQGYCGLMSITSLAAIALERYGAIAAPHSFWMKMSYGKKSFVILVMWIYCFIIVSPPLYGFGNYVAAGFLTTCCFDYIERAGTTRYFILYLFCLGLVIPSVIIVYSYVQIFISQRKGEQELKRRLEERLRVTAAAEENEREPMTQDVGEAPKAEVKKPFVPKGKEKRLAALMLVVILVFIGAWTPYAVVALMGQFGPYGCVKPWMAMVPSMVAKSSTLYNPFLYAFKDSRFQRALRKYVFGKQLAGNLKTDSLTTQTEAALMNMKDDMSISEADSHHMETLID